MDAAEIIEKLKETPYKYTYAARVYDHLKKDEDGNAHAVLNDLRIQLANPANADIARPIKEVLNNFRLTNL